jgi:GAF domain-containing protein
MTASVPPDDEQRFKSLARVAQAVSASLDLREVLDAVARAALGLLSNTWARIWVAEGDRLVLRAEAGALRPRDGRPATVVAFGEGLPGEVALTGRMLLLEDVSHDPRVVDWELAEQERAVSFIGLPLRAKDVFVGVLSLATRDAHRFTAQEVETLGTFADQAAIAIDNARLHERVAARVHRLQALTRLNHLISSSLDSEGLLCEIARATASAVAKTPWLTCGSSGARAAATARAPGSGDGSASSRSSRSTTRPEP